MFERKDSPVRPSAGSHLEQAAALAATGKPAAADPKTSSIGRRPMDPPRSNVLADETHAESLAAALGAIARIVGRTLGPHGGNTLVRDPHGSHFATKDGYTVLQHLTFVQETATMVLDHVRSVSRTLVRRVGDGSTSAVIMADALYESFRKSGVTDEFPPGAIQAAMTLLADMIADEVRAVARTCDHDAIETVATITSNNDPELGQLVGSIYRQYGWDANVFVGESDSDATVIRPEPGYRVLRGMIHDCFANEVGIDGATPTTCTLHDPLVMVTDGVVNQQFFTLAVVPLMNACLVAGRPFVLVAREVTSDSLEAVVKFKTSTPSAPVLFVDHATITRRAKARMGDLASVLGARVIDPLACPLASDPNDSTSPQFKELLAMCGESASVRATRSETVFITTGRRDEAEVRAREIDAQIERVDQTNNAESMADELAELRARVRSLRGTEVTLLAGGSTPQERKALHYLLDDAVLAVRAATRSGVVEGLGLTGARALQKPGVAEALAERLAGKTRMPKDAIDRLASETVLAFYDAYRAAAGRVLENGRISADVVDECLARGCTYNAVTREFRAVDAATVLNPAETDIEIARGAASIVGLLTSSNQTILTRPVAGAGLD